MHLSRDDFVPPSEEEGNQAEVDRTPPEFSIDDLLSQLRLEDTDALTIRELVDRIGLQQCMSNRKRVYRVLSDFLDFGTWEYGPKKQVTHGSGNRGMIQTYRPKKREGR